MGPACSLEDFSKSSWRTLERLSWVRITWSGCVASRWDQWWAFLAKLLSRWHIKVFILYVEIRQKLLVYLCLSWLSLLPITFPGTCFFSVRSPGGLSVVYRFLPWLRRYKSFQPWGAESNPHYGGYSFSGVSSAAVSHGLHCRSGLCFACCIWSSAFSVLVFELSYIHMNWSSNLSSHTCPWFGHCSGLIVFLCGTIPSWSPALALTRCPLGCLSDDRSLLPPSPGVSTLQVWFLKRWLHSQTCKEEGSLTPGVKLEISHSILSFRWLREEKQKITVWNVHK